MSAAHRWLDLDNRPTEALPRHALEERIERVLTLTNLGFMATVGRNGTDLQSGGVQQREPRPLHLPAADSPRSRRCAGTCRCCSPSRIDGGLGERVRRRSRRRGQLLSRDTDWDHA